MSYSFFVPNIYSKQKDFNSIVNKKVDLSDNVYILGAGDIISLNFYNLDKFSGEYVIARNNTIFLPLIGIVNVEGLSLEKLKAKLFKLYSKELISPLFELNIVKERPIKVSVVGQVNNPGLHNLTEDLFIPLQNNKEIVNSLQKKGNLRPTLIDALQMAGGITYKGDIENITLIRKLEGPNSGSKIANLNLLLTLKDGIQSQNPYLFDGDIIKIPKTEKRLSTIALSSSNVTSSIKNAYVIGEVLNPGPIVFSNSTTISEAIMKAGGPKYFTSNKGKILLLRKDAEGKITKKTFKLNLNQLGLNNKNPLVINDDIIYVSRSSFAKVVGGINAVTSPFVGIRSLMQVIDLIPD